jgi:hypothetical protein
MQKEQLQEKAPYSKHCSIDIDIEQQHKDAQSAKMSLLGVQSTKATVLRHRFHKKQNHVFDFCQSSLKPKAHKDCRSCPGCWVWVLRATCQWSQGKPKWQDHRSSTCSLTTPPSASMEALNPRFGNWKQKDYERCNCWSTHLLRTSSARSPAKSWSLAMQLVHQVIRGSNNPARHSNATPAFLPLMETSMSPVFTPA